MLAHAFIPKDHAEIQRAPLPAADAALTHAVMLQDRAEI